MTKQDMVDIEKSLDMCVDKLSYMDGMVYRWRQGNLSAEKCLENIERELIPESLRYKG